MGSKGFKDNSLTKGYLSLAASVSLRKASVIVVLLLAFSAFGVIYSGSASAQGTQQTFAGSFRYQTPQGTCTPTPTTTCEAYDFNGSFTMTLNPSNNVLKGSGSGSGTVTDYGECKGSGTINYNLVVNGEYAMINGAPQYSLGFQFSNSSILESDSFTDYCTPPSPDTAYYSSMSAPFLADYPAEFTYSGVGPWTGTIQYQYAMSISGTSTTTAASSGSTTTAAYGTNSTTTSSAGSSSGIPEFPVQYLGISVLSVVVAISYFMVRRQRQ